MLAETTAEEAFVGLDDAETRLPEPGVELKDRVVSTAVIAFILCVQLAWLGAFAYAAYVFVF
jgi:hypothetical protein